MRCDPARDHSARVCSVVVAGWCCVEMTAAVVEVQILPAGETDGLTADRIGAAGRVQASGSFCQVRQFPAGGSKRVDVLVEGLQVILQQIDNVMASALAPATKVQDGGYLGQGQTRSLGVPNEPEPVDRFLPVLSVPVHRPVRFGKKTDLLVVADRLGGGARTPGQLSDPHTTQSTPFTFQSTGRSRFEPSTTRVAQRRHPKGDTDMTQSTYALKTRTDLDMTDAETKVRELLAAEGFGILTEIDIAATLNQKLGINRRPYRILGACNPHLASQALESEADIGLLLPCNVVIYDDGEATVVAAVEPTTMVDLTGNPALTDVAEQAHKRLQSVIDSIRTNNQTA